jgi:hypothetical protein
VDRKDWASALPGLTAALREAGPAATPGWLLAASWGWLDDDIRLWLRYPSPATRRKQLPELGTPLAGLLAAADGTALAGQIVTVLREHGDDVLACLLATLRAAGPGPNAPFGELARDCLGEGNILGKPQVADGNLPARRFGRNVTGSVALEPAPFQRGRRLSRKWRVRRS